MAAIPPSSFYNRIKMSKLLFCFLLFLGFNFQSDCIGHQVSTKDQDAFRSLCAHVRDSMSVPRGVIIVVFFFSPGSCELCSSEVNYGWILAGEAVHRNLRIFA